MVFFSCDGCGEMLKKNKVDAHAARCRQCASVSCVDCSVSFWGDDYRLHTSCISEAERYEKSVYSKPKKTKRNPQQEWMDIVETCASSAPPHLSHHFNTMTTLDNIPRQEKKFVNFASNSLQLRGHNKKIVDEIWSCLKQEREKRIAERDRQQKEEKEKKELAEKEKQQQLERAAASRKSEEKKFSKNGGDNDLPIDAKQVKKIAKKTLKKAQGKSMAIKALRKTVGKELGLPKSAKKQLKKILLETAKASKDKIIIDGEIIRLKMNE